MAGLTFEQLQKMGAKPKSLTFKELQAMGAKPAEQGGKAKHHYLYTLFWCPSMEGS